MRTNKVAFVIDGYFGFTFYKHIKSTYGKVINFDNLVNSSCKALGKLLDEKCISPANLRHYYMGTDLERKDASRIEYEIALSLSRFGARGRPLRCGKEKCIDTMLFSDIKEEATAGAFDYLILLAGDLDHITLVQDLKAMGVKTILLCGEIVSNGVKTTSYSEELRRACFDSVNLMELLENQYIFQSAEKESSSMTKFMKSKPSNHNVQQPLRQSMHQPVRNTVRHPARRSVVTVHTRKTLLQNVIDAVNQTFALKQEQLGKRVPFVYQTKVLDQLNQNGIRLPMPLNQYLDSYPTVFRTGAYSDSRSLIVSLRKI